MKQINVKEFSIKTTKYINSRDDIVITKHGKPVAIVSKISKNSIESVLLELQKLMKNANISKTKLLRILKEVRKDVYA